MGGAEIASLAFNLLSLTWTAAKQAGLVGNPDWVKYADAGLYIATVAAKIIPEALANPARYEAMGASEILTLLTPKTWDEIEAQAKAELARPAES